jgi:hypothetical protein
MDTHEEENDSDLDAYNSLVETLEAYVTDMSSPMTIDLSSSNCSFVAQHNHILWSERCKVAPSAGTIRLLTEPAEDTPWAGRDFSLSQWITLLSAHETASAIFHENQQRRWRAKAAFNRWRHTMWMRKTQCNVDMIDMAPVKASDAIFVTDVKHQQVFRFHRRDVFNSLISNIGMSDEMMPYPRPPTNPWTNQVLTLAQTIRVCEQLVEHYGRQGRCPPVLFAAFCASRYDVTRFKTENSSLLAQHAIVSYFKDLTADNGPVVEETMTNLLGDAGLNYSPTAIRRWLQMRPITPLHREWMSFVQDYTLYMNLHVQVRPRWITHAHIRQDVRSLYSRTTIPAPPPTAGRRAPVLRPNHMEQLAQILNDPSGNIFFLNNQYTIQFLQNALFRY